MHEFYYAVFVLTVKKVEQNFSSIFLKGITTNNTNKHFRNII